MYKDLVKHAKHWMIYHRIENKVCEGMPDLVLSYCGFSFWIENKVVKNKNDKIKFRPSQLAWHRTAYQNREFSFTLVYNEFDRLYYLCQMCNWTKLLYLFDKQKKITLNNFDFITIKLENILAELCRLIHLEVFLRKDDPNKGYII